MDTRFKEESKTNDKYWRWYNHHQRAQALDQASEGKLDFLVSIIRRLNTSRKWIINRISDLVAKTKVLQKAKDLQKYTATQKAGIIKNLEQANGELKQAYSLKTDSTNQLEELKKAIMAVGKDISDILSIKINVG